MQLPIWSSEQAILDGLKTHKAVLVSAETGSGKSTQIPQMLWRDGYAFAGETGKRIIAVSQPRRVAASSVAKRVAEEIGITLGKEVGYAVRFDQEASEETEVFFATEGVLLQQAKQDSLFSGYSVLMLDEVHERSLDMDALLGLAKLAIRKRPDLRIVVSSATINVEKLAEFFGKDALLIESEGRAYEVEEFFEEEDPTRQFTRATQYNEEYAWAEFSADKAAMLINAGETEDILVFLPGLDDLRRGQTHLAKKINGIEAIICHGKMTLEEQSAIFELGEKQRVIFATNVAETSLTIPGIGAVINSGLVKKDFHNPKTGVTALNTVWSSKASVAQRRGRAGRVQDGRCYNLFTAAQYEAMEEFDLPQIHRADLGNVILSLAKIGIGDIRNFPFIDPPKEEALDAAIKQLQQIGALNETGQLTPYGEMVASFPLEPGRAHLLLHAEKYGAVKEVATFLAMVEADPYRRAKDRDSLDPHRQLTSKFQSDPEMHLGVFTAYEKAGYDWKWAGDSGLRPKAMNEARQVRDQLLEIASKHGLHVNQGVEVTNLKRALIAALPERLSRGADFFSYYNQAHEKIYIFPGSRCMESNPMMIWYYSARDSRGAKGWKRYALQVLGITPTEIVELFPDEVVVRLEERIYSWSDTVYIDEITEFRGFELGRREIEKNYRYTPTSELIRGKSPETEDPPESEYDHEAAEAILKTREAELEAKFAPRREELRSLVAGMPEVDQDSGYTSNELARELRRLATIKYPAEEELERTKVLLRRLREKLEEIREYRAEQAEILRRTSEAFKQELRQAQELLETAIEIDLSLCPVCGALFDDNDLCDCVQSLGTSQIEEATTKKVADKGGTDLVRLESDKGELLARIYLYNSGNGRPREIRREVIHISEPFEDIVTVR